MLDQYSVSALSRWATALFVIIITVCMFGIVEMYRREFETRRKKIERKADSTIENWINLYCDKSAAFAAQEQTIAELRHEVEDLNAKLERQNELLGAVKLKDLKGEN